MWRSSKVACCSFGWKQAQAVWFHLQSPSSEMGKVAAQNWEGSKATSCCRPHIWPWLHLQVIQWCQKSNGSINGNYFCCLFTCPGLKLWYSIWQFLWICFFASSFSTGDKLEGREDYQLVHLLLKPSTCHKNQTTIVIPVLSGNFWELTKSDWQA